MLTKPFSVLVADQHSVARAGVKAVLARERCKVIEASDGREAVRLTMKHRPHIAVLDIQLAELNGILAAHEILNSRCGTRVLILTADERDETIERAMTIKVQGYLCKSTPIEQLSEAVKTLRLGLEWFDAVVRAHLARHAHLPEYARRKSPLTEQELKILQLIAEGYSKKIIAAKMDLSPKTVDRHQQNMMDKLNRHSAASLTSYAIRENFVEPK